EGTSVVAITMCFPFKNRLLYLCFISFILPCFANSKVVSLNIGDTIVTQAVGLDFKINDNFSSATFPPPTIRTLRLQSFKNMGYRLFRSVPSFSERDKKSSLFTASLFMNYVLILYKSKLN